MLLQIEYHLVEFRGGEGGDETRLSLTAPEVLALLAHQDAAQKP